MKKNINQIISLCGEDGLTITKTIDNKEITLSAPKERLKSFLITQIGNDEKQADLILKHLGSQEKKEQKYTAPVVEEVSAEEQTGKQTKSKKTKK